MMITGRENLTIESGSESQTEALGRKLAGILHSGELVVLSGALGAGKTCFIRGIGIGLGIGRDEIKSPSFTLINEYSGSLPLFHFDLYRLKEVSELYNIGWDDYLMRDGVVVVEWGEKAGEFLPDERIDISIDIISDRKRRLKISFKN